MEEDVESEEEEEEDMKFLSISEKWSAPGSSSKLPQRKVQHTADEEEDDDNNFDDEETEENSSEEIYIRYSSQKCTKIKPEWKRHKIIKTKIKKSKILQKKKKEENTLTTPKRPSPIEDLKAKMLAIIEKGSSLPKMKTTFINYIKNCFCMTD